MSYKVPEITRLEKTVQDVLIQVEPVAGLDAVESILGRLDAVHGLSQLGDLVGIDDAGEIDVAPVFQRPYSALKIGLIY